MVVALFLLSQVFLIISHGPLVHTLATIMLKSDLDTINKGVDEVLEKFDELMKIQANSFSSTEENLDKSTENLSILTVESDKNDNARVENEVMEQSSTPINSITIAEPDQLNNSTINNEVEDVKHLNVTDEEKQRLALESPLIIHQTQNNSLDMLMNKPFLETIMNSLFCIENDYATLFGLCLLYALINNQVF